MHAATGDHPRLVLVHGATSGPWAFDAWQATGWPELPGVEVVVPDLQRWVDVAGASMDDYAAEVDRAVDGARRTVICGWSMGGLLALMVASRRGLAGVVAIEASPPLEVHGGNPAIRPRAGTYTVEVYGVSPDATRNRPDSTLAFDERRRGVSVPAVDCPLLTISGKDYQSSASAIASTYGGSAVSFPDLDHVALVGAEEVRARVARFTADHVLGVHAGRA
jgi:pimeloyl-ACP methyl ester carboxylesterase